MVNVRGARSVGVYDARAGQAVLKLDPGNALLRPRCRSESPFPTGDAAHGMCFVEQEQSVELVAEPCQDLVKSAIATSFASQRSEEHTSELQSLMRISYAVFCLKKKNKQN